MPWGKLKADSMTQNQVKHLSCSWKEAWGSGKAAAPLWRWGELLQLGSQGVGECPRWPVGDIRVWYTSQAPSLPWQRQKVETLGICLPLLGGGTRESLGPPNSSDEGSLHSAGQDSGKDPDSPGWFKGSEGWVGPGRTLKGWFLFGIFRPSSRFYRCPEGREKLVDNFTGNCFNRKYTSVRNKQTPPPATSSTHISKQKSLNGVYLVDHWVTRP